MPVHTHRSPAVIHIVSSSDFVRRDPAGTVLVDSRRGAALPGPGSILWSAALPPHSLTNVGTGELRIIAVETKR